MCETASRQLPNLFYAPQATMEGHMQHGGNALREERCPRGSSIPTLADNTTSGGLFTRPFCSAVPNKIPPLPSQETLLRRTACGYQAHTFAGSLLSSRGLACLLCSTSCDAKNSLRLPTLNHRSMRQWTTRGQPTNNIPPPHTQGPSCISPPLFFSHF
jgi:hypothetical protein